MPNYCPGNGNPKAQLAFVGEAPGRIEDETKEPFKGPSGQFLWEICSELGIDRSSIWVTNVYKYRPPNNDIKRIAEVCNPREQEDKLWEELNDVNPNCVVALGGTAFDFLSGRKGILRWRGSVLMDKYGNRKLIGTLHPSNLIIEAGSADRKRYPYIWRSIIKNDLTRALKESRDATNSYSKPFITTAFDSLHLSRFLEQNRSRKRVAADIESVNCTPVCISLAFDRHEALVVPFFSRLNKLQISPISHSDLGYIWQQLDELFQTKDIVGQNFKYDQEKLEMLGFSFKRGLPIKSDTMLKAHTLIPELPKKSMEMLQSLWTDMPYHKDEGKEFVPGRDSIERLFQYGGLDAVSTYWTDEEMEKDLLEENLSDFYYNHVMHLHEIYLDMERVGFLPDLEKRAALKVKYESQHDLIQGRFYDNCGDFTVKGKKCHKEHVVNVAAPAQVKKLLYEYLKLPPRRVRGKISSDEDTIVQLLNNVVKGNVRQRSILTDIIEDRRTRKTLGTYVNARLDFDGRIRGTYRITGTETGRSSTATLSKPIRPFEAGHAFQTLTKHGTVGADIRGMYKSDPGYAFVQFDLSQAEPRIVAVLSEDEELQRAFETGKVDIHRRTAALVLEYTPSLDLSEKFNPNADNLPKEGGERFLGKKSRNGGNYDMGAGELALNIATDAKKFGINVSVSEWRAGKMIDNFHKGSPKIRSVFHTKVQRAICDTGVLTNPFGRKRRFYERPDRQTFKEGYAQIPQSTVADQVKSSMILVKSVMPDFGRLLMGEAHDALVFRFPVGEIKDRALVVKASLEREIDFSRCTLGGDTKLRIPVDISIGYENYLQLETYKEL